MPMVEQDPKMIKKQVAAKRKIAKDESSVSPGQRSKIANDQQASTDRSVGKMYNKVATDKFMSKIGL